MKFFFDNNVSERIARAVACLAEFEKDEVSHLKEKFLPNSKDVEWIPALAKEKDWIIISGDCKLRKKPDERTVFYGAGLTTFFLAPGWINVGFWEQAALLVRWWPSIRNQASLAEAGSVFEIPFRQTGRFKPIAPYGV